MRLIGRPFPTVPAVDGSSLEFLAVGAVRCPGASQSLDVCSEIPPPGVLGPASHHGPPILPSRQLQGLQLPTPSTAKCFEKPKQVNATLCNTFCHKPQPGMYSRSVMYHWVSSRNVFLCLLLTPPPPTQQHTHTHKHPKGSEIKATINI